MIEINDIILILKFGAPMSDYKKFRKKGMHYIFILPTFFGGKLHIFPYIKKNPPKDGT